MTRPATPIAVAVLAVLGLAACAHPSSQREHRTPGAALGAGSETTPRDARAEAPVDAGVDVGALEGRDDARHRHGEVGQREDLPRNQELLRELRRRSSDVRETARGIVIHLSDALFEFDRPDLTRDGRNTLRDVAAVLKRSGRGRRVSIEGHTDDVGSASYDLRLSAARADAVADALVSAGINRRRLRTSGFGKTRPLAPNRVRGRDNAEGRARNRCVEVIVENPPAPRPSAGAR